MYRTRNEMAKAKLLIDKMHLHAETLDLIAKMEAEFCTLTERLRRVRSLRSNCTFPINCQLQDTERILRGLHTTRRNLAGFLINETHSATYYIPPIVEDYMMNKGLQI